MHDIFKQKIKMIPVKPFQYISKHNYKSTAEKQDYNSYYSHLIYNNKYSYNSILQVAFR